MSAAKLKFLSAKVEKYFEVRGKLELDETGEKVNVRGHLYAKEGASFTSFPVTFGNVSHFMQVDNVGLTSLVGAPHSVGGIFSCDKNNLTSLVGGPSFVYGNYSHSSM
jgi:hypothetical protein